MKNRDIHKVAAKKAAKQAVKQVRTVKHIFLKFIFQLKSMTFAKYILFWYALITLVGALLLWSPIAQTGHIISSDPVTGNSIITNGHVSFINSLFTSASAFSDTGLSTDSAAISFTMFGQAVISILIFVGGIGWFALKVYIFNIIIGRPLSFRSRENLNAERGTSKAGISRELIKVAVTTLLVITVIASVVLAAYFYTTDVQSGQYLENVKNTDSSYVDANGHMLHISNVALHENPYHNPYLSLRWGVFHAISALNNAGFDIIGGSSLEPYYYHIGVQIIFVTLFVVGGMGYPVIYDVFMWSKTRFTGERTKFRFSLFTKLSVVAYVIISIVGLGVVFGIETQAKDSFWGSTGNYGSHDYKGMALFFNTMSTRNAGFATIDMHDLSRATLIQYIVMMFIGSAPSSTAGGIRTTTFAVIVLAIYSLLRGRSSVYAFKKQIDKGTVNRAFVVFAFSVVLVIAGSLISITSLDTNGGHIPTLDGNWVQDVQSGDYKLAHPGTHPGRAYDFTEVMFEVSSAFGTTGLSAGITPMLSIYSKITIILIMFIGQLGVSSTLLVWGKRKSSDKHFQRVPEEVSIG